MSNFSHKAASLSTDLHCYFECEQTFKKDFELHLHLKLKHRQEDQNELRKAFQAAEEEIALVRRSASTFQCALCPKVLHEDEPFRKHITKNHNWKWEDYKEQYGRCEVESAPFECKICGRVVKYSRNTVHGHLTSVHNITWPQYLDRIRKMRRGERPEELPQIESFDCRICNVTVKFILKHLERVHKITEQEYFELYPDQSKIKSRWYKGMASKWTPDEEDEKPNIANMNYGNQNMYGFQNNYQNNYSGQQYNAPSQQYNAPSQQYNAPVQFPDQPLPPPNDSFAGSNPGSGPMGSPMGYSMGNPVPPMSPYNNVNIQPSSDPQPIPIFNGQQTLPAQPAPFQPTAGKGILKPPKSDIQNTKNKNCSSCNTSFESRKGFIEHCTTFHQMKFKTASGQTISAQTISQKNQQEMQIKTEPNDAMQPNEQNGPNDAFKQDNNESLNGTPNQFGDENGLDSNGNFTFNKNGSSFQESNCFNESVSAN